MDINLAKCEQLVREAEKAGVVLAVDFDLRYRDLNRKIHLAVKKNILGRIFLVNLLMKCIGMRPIIREAILPDGEALDHMRVAPQLIKAYIS